MASGDRIQIADQTTSDLISNKVDCIEGYIGNAISDVVPAETSGKINIANQETSDEIVEKLNNLTKLEDKRNTTVVGAYRTEEANDIGVEPHAEGGNYLTVYTRPRESGYMTPDTLIKTWIPGLTADKVQAGVTFGSSLSLTGSYTSDATATAANILNSKTAYINGSKVTGTMTDNSTNTAITLSWADNRPVIKQDATSNACWVVSNSDGIQRALIQCPNNGYYSDTTVIGVPVSIMAARARLTADKIATGNTILGIDGTYKGLGNATAAQVLSGKTFSTASLSNATGTMTDNSAKTSTSSYVTGTFKSGTTGYVFATPTAGYCSASTYIRVPVANLSAVNIKKGVSIGGVVGTYDPLLDQTLLVDPPSYTGTLNSTKITDIYTDSPITLCTFKMSGTVKFYVRTVISGYRYSTNVKYRVYKNGIRISSEDYDISWNCAGNAGIVTSDALAGEISVTKGDTISVQLILGSTKHYSSMTAQVCALVDAYINLSPI